MDNRRQAPVVRPRILWGGIAVAVVGMLATAIMMVAGVGRFSWFAVALIAVGLGMAWLGGIAGSVEAGHPVSEHREQRDREAQAGTSLATRDGRQERARAAVATSRELERVRARSSHSAPPPIGPSAAVALVLLAGALVLSPWVLAYPFEPAAQDSILVQTGAAIVVAWCGFWLFQKGPSRFASGACLGVALVLVLSGLSFRHDYSAITYTQLVAAALIAAAAAGTIVGED